MKKTSYFSALKWLYKLIIAIILILFYLNFNKIPNIKQHVERNNYNVYPIGKLKLVSNNIYIDDNLVYWYKRSFLKSILHYPLDNYIFEEYNKNKHFSSETVISKEDFDKNIMKFKPSSFNYYSSIFHPIEHFFADVLPIILYLAPNYSKL